MVVKVVVDSSVILKWLYRENEPHLDIADALLRSAWQRKVIILVPELAKYEVGNALLTAKKLFKDQGKEAMELLYSLPIRFVPESLEVSIDTFALGAQSGVTYYDASFAALAKQEEAVLVTANPKHQIKIIGVKVVPLESYK